MPDATQLLSQDHRRVEQLFQQFHTAQDREIALLICQELTVHAEVEEELVYPVLRRIDKELEKEGRHEHDEARELIAKIEGLDGSSGLASLVEQLEQAVRHHVEEEESEAWPQLQEHAGDEMDDLGTKVAKRKQELMASGGAASSVPEDATKEELYEQAKKADISGRSKMDKEELKEALENEGAS